MDSFEWNKIFMGLGFSALAVLGINELTKAVYHTEASEPGKAYVVAGVEEVGTEATAGGDTGAPTPLPDFGTVLASADIAAGEKIAAKCAACHTWTKGGANGIGPNLYGVVGANHAHLGDAYAYSKAMAEKSGETWDYAALYQFIEAPSKAIKGTKMGFAGLKKSEERINLIAFMRTWSDSPYPLPAPNPAGAPAEEGAAPAEGTAPAEGATDGAATPAPAEGATEGAATPAPAEATPAPTEAAPATGEPAATPAPEPEATPAEAPEATPEATPAAESEATPAATPEATPAATPAPTP